MLTDIRLITVKEFHQMFDAGILSDSERVELIAGQIIKMAAKGTPHRAAVTRLWKLLEARLGDRVLVCPQEPVKLNDYSEPEPDIAVLRPDPLYYEDRHPIPPDIYLVVEVADTTLNKDCQIKAIAYAQSGISDYWVLDINARQLHVFRAPERDGYQMHKILSDRDVIAPLAFPDINLAVHEMLRPLTQ